MTNHHPQISVAPMMDWTDRHCRYFHRLIAPSLRLYTEMVTTGALLHNPPERFLGYDESEHPIALQLGGSEPDDLAKCTRMAADFDYDEINLNCGCPSSRVQKGAFGACLMNEPELVRDCIAAMNRQTDKPVTVKCRIGVDEADEDHYLTDFIEKVAQSGCPTFIIHARKAWLKGLSPKENRDIPPLNYPRIYRLKEQFPDLEIILNGGVKTLEDVRTHLDHLDGVMIGREAYQNPWFLREIETEIYRTVPDTLPSETEVVEQMMLYARHQYEMFNTPLHSISRHMTGLFQGQKGAKKWRQTLSAVPKMAHNDPDFILEQLALFKS